MTTTPRKSDHLTIMPVYHRVSLLVGGLSLTWDSAYPRGPEWNITAAFIKEAIFSECAILESPRKEQSGHGSHVERQLGQARRLLEKEGVRWMLIMASGAREGAECKRRSLVQRRAAKTPKTNGLFVVDKETKAWEGKKEEVPRPEKQGECAHMGVMAPIINREGGAFIEKSGCRGTSLLMQLSPSGLRRQGRWRAQGAGEGEVS